MILKIRMNSLVLVLAANPVVNAQDLDPQLISQWSMSAMADGYDYASRIEVRDRVAYVDTVMGLRIVDVVDPRTPRTVGFLQYDRTLVRKPLSIALSGDLAYLTCPRAWDAQSQSWLPGSLQIIDIANPGNPRRVGGLEARGHATDVAVAGGYAYMITQPLNNGSERSWESNWLDVIRVSDPTEPVRVGACDLGIGFVREVTISGRYAYVVNDHFSGPTQTNYSPLLVIDISDPTNPLRVGSAENQPVGWGSSMAVAGAHAYITGGIYSTDVGSRFGLHILDISEPTHPRWIGFDDDLVGEGIRLAGRFAYVKSAAGMGMALWDVGNPSNRRRIGGYDHVITHDVVISGQYAYLAGGRYDMSTRSVVDQLTILDIGVSANPQRVTTLGTVTIADEAWPMAVERLGDYLLLAYRNGGVTIVDASNPATPIAVGSLAPHTPSGPLNTRMPGLGAGLALSGHHAFVLGDQPIPSVAVINVTDPTDPKLSGRFETRGVPLDISVVGGRAFVAAENADLEILDIGDPNKPRSLSVYEGDGSFRRIAASGDYAFAIVYEDTGVRTSLQVLDVRNSNALRVVGRFEFTDHLSWIANGNSPPSITDIFVSGTLAYVTQGHDWGFDPLPAPVESLVVFDVSDPTNPRRIGGFSTTSGVSDAVHVSGSLAYVADRYNGLDVFDVSNPTSPKLIGGNSAFRRGVNLLVNGDHVFVVGPGGLIILNKFTNLRFGPASVQAGAGFKFLLSGAGGQRIRVQRSANLKDWEDWQTVTLGSEATELIDAEASHVRACFYRAIGYNIVAANEP